MSAIHWEILLFILCILFSAFFSACETALISLSEARARQILEEGGQRARTLEMWLRFPNRMLITILVGNNLVNITAGAISTDIASRVLEHSAMAVAVGVSTILVLVFGEVVPKTFARHHNEALAIYGIKVLRVFYFVFYYTGVSWVLFRIAQGIVSAGAPVTRRPFITEKELEFLIRVGSKEGLIAKEKSRLMQSAIKFGEKIAREVMVPRTNIVSIDISTTYSELASLIKKYGHSRVPVCEDTLDRIVGILHVKEILMHDMDCASRFEMRPLLRKPHFVPASQKIEDLLKDLQKRKAHMAVVVDEFGGTAGIVTVEDIIEEIVGEIEDEFDTGEERKIVDTGKRIFADGQAPLHEIEEYLSVKFPSDGGYETVGGFVTSFAGRIPQRGWNLVWNGIHFTIKEADERKVMKVEIRKPLPSAELPSSPGARRPQA